MSEFVGIFIFFAVVALCVGCRLVAGRLNRERIREYVEEKGGSVVKIVWDPFGPGWFGEKSDAIYEVDYRDREGDHRRAHCKTSMFSGVYMSNDKLVFSARPKPRPEPAAISPEEENRRLREENERLKEELCRLAKE